MNRAFPTCSSIKCIDVGIVNGGPNCHIEVSAVSLDEDGIDKGKDNRSMAHNEHLSCVRSKINHPIGLSVACSLINECH